MKSDLQKIISTNIDKLTVNEVNNKIKKKTERKTTMLNISKEAAKKLRSKIETEYASAWKKESVRNNMIRK